MARCGVRRPFLISALYLPVEGPRDTRCHRVTDAVHVFETRGDASVQWPMPGLAWRSMLAGSPLKRPGDHLSGKDLMPGRVDGCDLDRELRGRARVPEDGQHPRLREWSRGERRTRDFGECVKPRPARRSSPRRPGRSRSRRGSPSRCWIVETRIGGVQVEAPSAEHRIPADRVPADRARAVPAPAVAQTTSPSTIALSAVLRRIVPPVSPWPPELASIWRA